MTISEFLNPSVKGKGFVGEIFNRIKNNKEKDK